MILLIVMQQLLRIWGQKIKEEKAAKEGRKKKEEDYKNNKSTLSGTEESDGHRETKQEPRQSEWRMYLHVKWVLCQDCAVGL